METFGPTDGRTHALKDTREYVLKIRFIGIKQQDVKMFTSISNKESQEMFFVTASKWTDG